MTLDAWLTANLISLSYITGLEMPQNRKRNVHVRQHLIRAKLSAVRNGPHGRKDGLHATQYWIVDKNKAEPAHGKPIWNKSWPNFTKDKGQARLRTETAWAALRFPPQTTKVRGYRPRKTELNGQLFEIGQSKV